MMTHQCVIPDTFDFRSRRGAFGMEANGAWWLCIAHPTITRPMCILGLGLSARVLAWPVNDNRPEGHEL